MQALPWMAHATPPDWPMPLATAAFDDPRTSLMLGLWFMVCGFLFFRHREAVGESTNYAIGGIPVTARTPSFIVGFFGVMPMLAGAFVTVASLWQILAC